MTNKKALETKIVVELILSLVLTVILIFLIYNSQRSINVYDDSCLQSVVLAKKLKDLSVINCPYHYQNLSKDVEFTFAKEIISCWVRFGQGKIKFEVNKHNPVFCYLCSILSYDNKTYYLSINNITYYIDMLSPSNNLKSRYLSFDLNQLNKGDKIYVFYAINKTKKGLNPYVGINKHFDFDKCKLTVNVLR